MKSAATDEVREYPHVVVRGVRRNTRWPIVVSDWPASRPATSPMGEFRGPGMLHSNGSITGKAREMIVARMARVARSSEARHCVVWSPTSCTWFDGDGRHRDGASPPDGEIIDPWLNADVSATLEWCWTIELPAGGEWSHLGSETRLELSVMVAGLVELVLAAFGEDDAAPLLVLVAADREEAHGLARAEDVMNVVGSLIDDVHDVSARIRAIDVDQAIARAGLD